MLASAMSIARVVASTRGEFIIDSVEWPMIAMRNRRNFEDDCRRNINRKYGELAVKS